MKKLKYPVAGLTKSEREVFEDIATGNIRRLSNFRLAVVKKLLEIGAIVCCGEKQICKDQFGEVWVPEYCVPIPLHMIWCKYCSETIPDEDIA